MVALPSLSTSKSFAMHLLKAEPKPVKPSLAQTRALIADLREQDRILDAREDREILRRGKTPIPRTMALREGRDESGRLECFIPKRRYWKLRQKYGRQLFTTDSGLKDLRHHHPEWFTETISHRITFAFTARGRANYDSIFRRPSTLDSQLSTSSDAR